MRKTRCIAVDFDGTICKYMPFNAEKIEAEPMENAQKALKMLKNDGYEIIVFTARLCPFYGEQSVKEQKEKIEKWLEDHDIPYDMVTNNKPHNAMAYIDDRAIRFENNWNSIINYFL